MGRTNIGRYIRKVQYIRRQQTMTGIKCTTYPIGEGTASGLSNEGAFLIYKKDGTGKYSHNSAYTVPIQKQI